MNNVSLEKAQQWLIIIAVMLVTIIEVLDMTIVSVALPHMMGSLGASTNQVTWIMTSYTISAVIIMPLTGFLVNRVGRKKLLLICIAGFMLASTFCGMSDNILQIVFFRVLQGAFGAVFVPISQYILQESFPDDQQEKAMAIWGIGIMVAPVFGPTIGGLITEAINWRWIFYLNIPICLFALLLSARAISESEIKKSKVDKVGMFWLALGLGTLQIFLDNGSEKNWLESNFMVILLAIWGFSLSFFIYRGLTIKDNIINLHLFWDRNFLVSTILISLACIGMFALFTIQPIQVEHLLNYPVAITGLIMAPRGITCAIAMVMVAVLSNRFDSRYWIVIGLFLSGIGTFWLDHLNLQTTYMPFVWGGIVQGLGMGFLFVPLSAIALSTLNPKDTAEAAGLFSFGRTLGGSVGISIVSTLLTHSTQVKWNEIGGHINFSNPALHQWLTTKGSNIHDLATSKMLGYEIYRQASMIAYNNCHWFIAWSFMVLIPFVFLLRRPVFGEQK